MLMVIDRTPLGDHDHWSIDMSYDGLAFVLQRRVNTPLADLQRGLADRSPLTATRRLDLGDRGCAVLRDPFRPVTPLGAHQPLPTWCGNATLLTSRGGRVADVDVEVSMWSPDATCLTVRPVARHPERWSRRRVHRYFELAHGTIDAVGRALVERAGATANETARGRAQDPRVGSRTTARSPLATVVR